jgi:pimeloyl-ACP methyl ester carboxylesterase
VFQLSDRKIIAHKKKMNKRLLPLILISLAEFIALVIFPLVYVLIASIGSNNAAGSAFVSYSNPFPSIWISIMVALISLVHLIDVWYDIPLRKLFGSGDSKFRRRYSILWLFIRFLIALALMLLSFTTWVSYAFITSDIAAGWWAFALLVTSVLIIGTAIYKRLALAKSGRVSDVDYLETGEDEDFDTGSEYFQFNQDNAQVVGLTAKAKKRRLLPKITKFRLLNCFLQFNGVLFLIILIFILCTITIQSLLMAVEISSVTRPGSLVPVHNNDYKLHIYCTGSKDSIMPTVIIDSDIGVASPYIYWAKVQSGFTNDTRVCVYGRAGYGWSNSGVYPRVTTEIVSELKEMLDASGEKRPYVLVGHGFGGFNVRVFTSLYPDLVKGLLLVDAMHENQQLAFWKARNISQSEGYKLLDSVYARMNFFRVSSAFCVYRLINSVDSISILNPFNQNFTSYQMKVQQFSVFQNKFPDVVWSESVNSLTISANEVKNTRGAGFGNLPLIVLTAGAPINGTCAQNYFPPSSTLCKEHEKYLKQDAAVIYELQQDLASLSQNSTWQIVWNSSHNIPIDQPEVVINEIYKLVRNG